MPMFCAHSGFNGHPDNSLSSIRAGAAAGLALTEVDVRLTSDGVPVCWHDAMIRLDGRETNIAATPAARVRASHPDVVFLADALPVVRLLGLTLNLDLKVWQAAAPCAKLCADADILPRAHFSGLEPGDAGRVAELHLPVRHLLNVPEALAANPALAVKTACDEGCFGLNLNYRLFTPELLDLAHRNLLWVWVWTVNLPEDMLRFMATAVDGITTRTLFAP